MFHVLLRRLTPRHPPYALSSFALPAAESFAFHFSPAPPPFGTATPAFVFTFLSSLRYAVGNVLAAGTRPTAPEERLFRFGVVRRALGRNEFRRSVREPNQGFGRHQLFSLLLSAAVGPVGLAVDKTARHIAGLQEVSQLICRKKSYSVREGCRVNKCSCVLNG